jgi:hypothetical protein
MPTTNSVQYNAALVGTTPISTTGVQVPNSGGAATGGIYVNGNITNMTLSASNNVNQVITITQVSSGKTITSVVTLNAQTNQTSVAVTQNGSTNTSVYSGLTNGVMYVNGNIGTSQSDPGQGLSGVVADNTVSGGAVTHYNTLTIATTPTSTIYFNGSVLYNTQRTLDSNGVFESESASFVKNAGVLGLVSQNMYLLKYGANGSVVSNYQIDAATVATGIFDAEAYQDSSVIANFYGMGSYVAGTGGYFGLMTLNGVMQAGYYEHHSYDPRLASCPPPYFPTTGQNYDILSWSVDSKTCAP